MPMPWIDFIRLGPYVLVDRQTITPSKLAFMPVSTIGEIADYNLSIGEILFEAFKR